MQTGFKLEYTHEVSFASESAGEGHFVEALLPVSLQQEFGMFDPMPQQPVVRAEAGCTTECP